MEERRPPPSTPTRSDAPALVARCRRRRIDAAQGVIAAPGELSGDGDGGQLAVVGLLQRRVVVVVRSGDAGGVLGRLVEGPAQRLGSLRDKKPLARRRSEASTVMSRPVWRTTCIEREKRWQSPSSAVAEPARPRGISYITFFVKNFDAASSPIRLLRTCLRPGGWGRAHRSTVEHSGTVCGRSTPSGSEVEAASEKREWTARFAHRSADMPSQLMNRET